MPRWQLTVATLHELLCLERCGHAAGRGQGLKSAACDPAPGIKAKAHAGLPIFLKVRTVRLRRAMLP